MAGQGWKSWAIRPDFCQNKVQIPFLLANHLLNDRWLSPEDFPNNRFSTLISSSESSQCIPAPSAINRQLFLSLSVAYVSLWYQTIGAETVLPSSRSTVMVFSSIATCLFESKKWMKLYLSLTSQDKFAWHNYFLVFKWCWKPLSISAPKMELLDDQFV